MSTTDTQAPFKKSKMDGFINVITKLAPALVFIGGLLWSVGEWKGDFRLLAQKHDADIDKSRSELRISDEKIFALINALTYKVDNDAKSFSVLMSIMERRLGSVEEQQKIDRDILIRLNSLEIKMSSIQSDISDIKKQTK